MSTVAKGTAFENRVFAAIQRELASNHLGLSPSAAKTFQRKGYYSRDRDSDIITDISIEVWPPSAPNWSILWVCECKDYKGSVPVDDVEEFKAKLDQITGANRKGVMAVTGALQDGALKFARSNGIGIIRLLPSDQVQYVLACMSATAVDEPVRLSPSEFRAALTQPSFVGTNRDFYAVADGYIYGSWSALLRTSLQMTAPTGG